jgi:hypothetical protein
MSVNTRNFINFWADRHFVDILTDAMYDRDYHTARRTLMVVCNFHRFKAEVLQCRDDWEGDGVFYAPAAGWANDGGRLNWAAAHRAVMNRVLESYYEDRRETQFEVEFCRRGEREVKPTQRLVDSYELWGTGDKVKGYIMMLTDMKRAYWY